MDQHPAFQECDCCRKKVAQTMAYGRDFWVCLECSQRLEASDKENNRPGANA